MSDHDLGFLAPGDLGANTTLTARPGLVASEAVPPMPAESEQLAGAFAEIERAIAALREGEPTLERWTGSPAAAQQRRPVWPLVGLLWLSAALITAAALVALAALLG